jgi:hypothetical protein
MRMLKKGGAPRDRRINRRKVAMAAAAVLFLFATAAQAQNFADYQIDASQSWLGIRNSGFIAANDSGTFLSPFLATTSENPALVQGAHIPNGSLDARIRGDVWVASTPGSSVQFLSTGVQQIDQFVTGNYKPGRDSSNNVTNSVASPGNEGGLNSGVAATINGHGNQYSSPGSFLNPVTGAGPTALPTDGLGNFDVTGVTLPQTQGVQDIISAVAGTSIIGLAGNNYPVNFSQTYANGVATGGTDGHGAIDGFTPLSGNIDPVTFHLVLPVNFLFWSRVTSGGHLQGYLISTVEGQIVADPVVPEPSTMVLAAFGVVGLLSYAWRTRKRKALVA